MMKNKSKNVGSQSAANMFPIGGEGVEIGVWEGDSTSIFAEKSSHVHAVDAWDVSVFGDPLFKFMCDKYCEMFDIEPTLEGFRIFYDNVYDKVLDRFADVDNVSIYRMTSKDWFEQNTKKDYDWLYIDGDHEYEGCLYDICEAWKILKPDGVLYGDDFPNKDGVTHAVNHFCSARGVVAKLFSVNQWYIKKGK